VPFTAFFPAGVADPTLIARLTGRGELRGLLRAAVGGLQQVMRRGRFDLPASVVEATERFKQEADPMRGFIEERVSFHHELDVRFTTRTDLYGAYTAWAAMNGFQAASAARFYELFLAAATDTSEYPVRLVKLHGTYGFKGVNLK
jgi:phage/plasmid-associated DNA primase